MKKIMVVLLLVFANYSYAKDMNQYRKDTANLITMGKYKKALERTIWFHHNALKHQKSMSSVRLTFALSDWYELGKKYPPALEALKSTRDRKVKLVLSGTGTPAIFRDVIAINRALSEETKLIVLFRLLDSKQPELAKKSWYVVEDLIIKSKDYKLANKYIGNILAEYSGYEKGFIRRRDFYAKNKEKFGDKQKSLANEMYIVLTVRLIVLAKKLNKSQAAAVLVKKASIISRAYDLNYDFNTVMHKTRWK